VWNIIANLHYEFPSFVFLSLHRPWVVWSVS